jgi:hypothetical protein
MERRVERIIGTVACGGVIGGPVIVVADKAVPLRAALLSRQQGWNRPNPSRINSLISSSLEHQPIDTLSSREPSRAGVSDNEEQADETRSPLLCSNS